MNVNLTNTTPDAPTPTYVVADSIAETHAVIVDAPDTLTAGEVAQMATDSMVVTPVGQQRIVEFKFLRPSRGLAMARGYLRGY